MCVLLIINRFNGVSDTLHSLTDWRALMKPTTNVYSMMIMVGHDVAAAYLGPPMHACMHELSGGKPCMSSIWVV